MSDDAARSLRDCFLRLRPDASVEPLNVDDRFWQRLGSGEFGAFHNEYLVTCHATEPGPGAWEMHPHGDEIVCLLSGAASVRIEGDDGVTVIALDAEDSFVVVPQGRWHRVESRRASRLLFITAGEGTRHR